MRHITSQLTRFEDVVKQKQAARDYGVSYVELSFESETIRLVVDGHHSYEAARRDGVDPEWIDVTDEYQDEIDQNGAQEFLDDHNNGEGWWELESGNPAW